MAGLIKGTKSFIRHAIKCPNAAERLAKTIIETPNDCIILPSSTQFGLLIANLLNNHQFSSLAICEPDQVSRDNFQNYLETIKPSYKVVLYPDDLEQLSLQTYSNEAQGRCSEIMKASCENLNKFPREKTGNVKYLLSLRSFKADMSLLNYLYDHTTLKLGLYANNTYPIYYLLMTNRRLSFLQSKSSDKNLKLYKPISVSFNTIFNIQDLLSFDLKDTFELRRNQIHKIKNHKNSDIHLVRLEPNKQLIESVSSQWLQEYKFFVKQLMIKPRSKTLPTIGKWFKVDKKHISSVFNINENSKNGDMEYEQYWKLYMYLRRLPFYKKSVFSQAYQFDNIRYSSKEGRT